MEERREEQGGKDIPLCGSSGADASPTFPLKIYFKNSHLHYLPRVEPGFGTWGKLATV